MKNLVRIDVTGHHGFHGWEARTEWRGRIRRRKFSDSRSVAPCVPQEAAGL